MNARTVNARTVVFAQKVVSAKIAALALEVSAATICNWIRRGTLYATRLGDKWRIPTDQIRRYLRATEATPRTRTRKEKTNGQ